VITTSASICLAAAASCLAAAEPSVPATACDDTMLEEAMARSGFSFTDHSTKLITAEKRRE